MSPRATTRVPLWRDVRVLQWLFQIAAVAVAVAIVLWLLNNYTTNSSRQNIPTNFNFLHNPAAFEITGNPMSQRAPVSDAIYQGFLNTLRVSVAGVVAATVLGTMIGIGRLSKNWLVRTISAVYVETFRNTPLALLVVFGFSVLVVNVLPTIQDAWTPLGLMVFSNRGIAGPWYVGSGQGLLVLSLVGLLLGWGTARWRRSVSDRTGALPRSGLWAIGVFVVVFAVGWLALDYSVTLPDVEGRRSVGGMRIDPSFFALFFALVIYTASHIAEIVRGSIQAVPIGQGEAGTALALSGFQRMWYVILPQAFRIGIPPIGNQYLNLIKNSSLGAAIGYYDLTLVARTTIGNGSPAVPVFALTMGIYIVISLVTSLLVNIGNRRFALVER